MKTKFLFAATLAALAFTSCQKDGSGQDPVQSGQDTYIGMTIQLPASAITRAPFQEDANATEVESVLTYVTVGTWSPNDGAVTYTDLNVSELTNLGNGKYTATTAVKAKTGINKVIVFANTMRKPTIQEINGAAFEATVTDIASDNKFVMYSDQVTEMTGVVFASKEEAEAGIPSNKVEVNLRRAAAKVAMKSLLAETVNGVADGLNNGLLTNIVWNIANQNTQMTVLSKFLAGTEHIASNVKSPFTRLATPAPMTSLPKSGAAASVAYCLENAHGTDSYNEDNTTAVQISATFAPGVGKYVSGINGTNATDAVIVPGAMAMTAGDAFYVSKIDIGTQVTGTFFSETAVNNAETIFGVDKSNDFTKYVDGKCYWAIWVNDGAAKPSYGVLRNHMYTINIKGIRAPGFPAFPDSDNPIAADTWILVSLDVEMWKAKDMGNIEL